MFKRKASPARAGPSAPSRAGADVAPTLPPRPPQSPAFDDFPELRAQSSRTNVSLDCIIPNEEAHPKAYQLAREVFSDNAIIEFTADPENSCAEAAKRVQKILQGRLVDTEVRQVLMWRTKLDTMPHNHMVVLASIETKRYVVDPTAEQFSACRPMFVPEAEWKEKIKAACPTRAMVYADYPNVTRAEAQATTSLFGGHALSLSGGIILNEPGWYSEIRSDPEAFEQQMEARGKDQGA